MWKDYGNNTIHGQREKQWFSQELEKMEKAQVIRKGNSDTVINPIHLVPKKGPSQFRQILDLRKINGGSQPDRFKMETLQSVLKFLRKGMYATKIDLAQGYFHIPIHENSKRLLGFIWDGMVYEFQALPFGLNSAPVIFTKVMREVCQKWREDGIIIFIYIDDILVLSNDRDICQEHTQRILQDLKHLGFMIKPEKCILIPTQILTFLGIELNFQEGKISIPQEKMEIAMDSIDSILKAYRQRTFLKVRWIAQFIGKMQFLTIAQPEIAIFLARLQKNMDQVVQQTSWTASMKIMRGPMKDMLHLKDCLYAGRGTPFEMDWDLVLVNTDSSLRGFGAHSQALTFSGEWEDTNEDHINHLELKAVLEFFNLASHQQSYPRGTQFHLQVDNMVAMSYVRKGYGKVEQLAKIARDIWILILKQDWKILKVSYIPLQQNEIADKLSRLADWRTSKELLRKIEEEFGPHHVDRFASPENALLTIYNSYTRANDALREPWLEQEGRSYCCPPLGLIPQSLLHVIRSETEATFILPYWTSASWWPIMLKITKRLLKVPRNLLMITPSSELCRNSEWEFIAVDVNGSLYKM